MAEAALSFTAIVGQSQLRLALVLAVQRRADGAHRPSLDRLGRPTLHHRPRRSAGR